MSFLCRRAGILPAAAMAIFLVAAQAFVAAHALEHDAGNAQKPVCATCVAAGQLAAAAVDSGPAPAGSISAPSLRAAPEYRAAAIHALVARQRGPPVPA